MRIHAVGSFALLLLVAGCGGGTGNTGSKDMSVGPDLTQCKPDPNLLSMCGRPCDKGNSIGVGKFCMTIGDCGDDGTKTNICSSLGNGPNPSADDTYFCTIYPCKQDGGVDQCGENATCVCGSAGGTAGCACTPNSCLGGGDGGA